ncbi:Ger(x)C family spore germination protein [Virgibacillus sp. W0181]|uniref:Ger(x)C family spore germination protein n=1 Tax=Virgibacillus sp. W0181 TaxID=3391581 RepID=UPI003F48C878
MMRYFRWTIMLLLLTGCIPSHHLEELGIITGQGIDLTEEDKIETTVTYLKFEPKTVENSVAYGSAYTLKHAITNANKQSDYELVLGKLKMELYGKQLAEKGLSPYLDLLGRDPNVPDMMNLAVSNTTAKEILELQEKSMQQNNVGQFLFEIIEKKARDKIFPKVTFSKFVTHLHDVGKDPILPIFELTEENIPEITAIAIFKNDQFVGQISIEYTTLINLFEKRVKDRPVEVTVPLEPFRDYMVDKQSGAHQQSLHIASGIIAGNATITLKDKNEPSFLTEINMDLNVLELSEMLIMDKKGIVPLLEKEINKKLTAQFEKMLAQLIELNADPLGYGAIYRKHTKNGELSDKEWREKYPNSKIDVKLKANVIHHGEWE